MYACHHSFNVQIMFALMQLGYVILIKIVPTVKMSIKIVSKCVHSQDVHLRTVGADGIIEWGMCSIGL
uniref:Putative secreted protein n=1 Tax=Panstrongylus lignarius TaxID=156445 RepID=A0A224XV18_9HEMI